jgi:hypothetical protein
MELFTRAACEDLGGGRLLCLRGLKLLVYEALSKTLEVDAFYVFEALSY